MLEIVDHFVANFGLVAIGLLECLILGWLYRLYKFREHANNTSEIRIGTWWDCLIKYVIPGILIVLLSFAVINNIIGSDFPDYPQWFVLLVGFLPLIAIVVISVLLHKTKTNQKEEEA
jgi:NSS family neurotransmitter:Na+ symporter